MNKTSLNKLKTCHPNIIKLAKAVDDVFPIQCICGKRDQEAQDKAYKSGMSKAKYPNSKHNTEPLSMAGDFIPDPDRNPATVDWDDIKSFELMCSIFKQKADELEIKIRLGKDFKFKDFPHVELI